MHTFQDLTKREWRIIITVGAIRRVQQLTGVDLLEAITTDLPQRLVHNPVLLVDILYALCKPQAEKDGITDEQFGEAMGGDSIESATTAFLEELVDFFPQRRRELLQKAVAKHQELEMAVLAEADKRLDGIDVNSHLQAAIHQASQANGNSFTTAPQSSESTPSLTPSDN